MTPFFMETGTHPRLPASLQPSAASPDVTDFATRLESALRRGLDAAAEAQIRMTAQLNAQRKRSPFRVGDKVYLSTEHLSFPAADSPKFKERFIGPFTILELHGHGNAVKLDLPAEYLAHRMHPVVNVSRLKKFTERPPHLGPSHITNPPPIATADDGQQFYEVDHIVTMQVRKGGKRFVRVRWKGYAAQHDTWEPYEKILADCPVAITTYEATHRAAAPRAPRPRRTTAPRTPRRPARAATPPPAAQPTRRSTRVARR
jgi:hypothetical protein